MVDYITYNQSNVSSFAQGYDYGADIMYQGTRGMSHDIFSVLVLLGIFLIFTGVSAKYNQERSFLFSSFVTSVAASLMVSGGFLDPIWSIVPYSVFLVSLFLWGSKS